MLSFSRFQYYSLPQVPNKHTFPRWFRFELGILAGCLYVYSADWDSLAHYLRPKGKAMKSTPNTDAGLELADGADPIKFADDPAAFVLEWLTLRRKTQDVLHTPMGYICMGRTLGENNPFREN
jgi:hypothetical protein